MTLECLLKRLVCCFIPYARWRHMIMRNRRDLVRVVEADGTERPLRLFEFRKLYVTEAKGLSGNVVRLSDSPGGGGIGSISRFTATAGSLRSARMSMERATSGFGMMDAMSASVRGRRWDIVR